MVGGLHEGLLQRVTGKEASLGLVHIHRLGPFAGLQAARFSRRL